MSHAEAFDPAGHIVLDVEIARPVEEAGGWGRTSQMGVGCAVVYDVARGRFRVFDHTEVDALRSCIARADRVTTWNGWQFDFPVIYGLDRPEFEASEVAANLRPRSRDLLQEIRAVVGPFPKGFGLDAVSESLFGVGKCGDGRLAPMLFQQGKWGQLITYCQHDVWMTARIEEFVDRHGFLVGAGGKMIRLRKWPNPAPAVSPA